MLKRRILVLLAALAALLGVLVLVLRPAPEPEPEYGGKKLSECVIELVVKPTPDFKPTAATEAISQMGTNTLPYLIDWVGYETPPWKRLSSWVATRIFRDSRWQFIDKTNVFRRMGAIYAFKTLGTKATPAIGNLSRIASDPKRSYSRSDAIQALGEIGVAALPAIVGVLTNEQSRTAKSSLVRIGCAMTLSHLAVEDPTTAGLAEPALLSMREDPDAEVRQWATHALRAIDRKWIENLRNAGHY